MYLHHNISMTKLPNLCRIRTFVFAGHDTISTTISMIYYFLSFNPTVRAKACSELDEVFGKSIDESAKRIRDDPHLLNRMPYCTGVIKETLRLFPPANTVRVGSPDVFITDPETGEKFPTYDWVVWPDSYVLGRHEKYFPEPQRFIPERWTENPPFPVPPAGAFRPFERGPRNCIGMEFGMLELKVVMALCLREFEFVPGYTEDADSVEGEKCYQMLFGSAKPKSSVPGTVKKVANL
jgi:cytochrome P450